MWTILFKTKFVRQPSSVSFLSVPVVFGSFVFQNRPATGGQASFAGNALVGELGLLPLCPALPRLTGSSGVPLRPVGQNAQCRQRRPSLCHLKVGSWREYSCTPSKMSESNIPVETQPFSDSPGLSVVESFYMNPSPSRKKSPRFQLSYASVYETNITWSR